MSEPTLFDLAEGRRRRDAGMERVTANTPLDWRVRFDAVLVRLARGGEPFTSEDITAVVGLPRRAGSGGNNVVGARMRRARGLGWIAKTGAYVPARRANQHATVIAQWVGVLEGLPVTTREEAAVAAARAGGEVVQ